MITIDQIYMNLYNTYGKQYWWPADNDIEMMIGAVLVQNTNWTNVETALKNFSSWHGHEILNMPLDTLIEVIKPAGFYTRKAQTIKNLLSWFETYHFDKQKLESIPTLDLRNELLSIHGIGEETCDCILLYLFNRPVFVVDAYLKRLLKRTGHPEMKSYQEIQNYMMNSLPLDTYLFQEFHALVVAYGKDHLKPTPHPTLTDPLNDETPFVSYSLAQIQEISNQPFIAMMIDTYGYIQRPSHPDPFWGIIYAIVGQLISAPAAKSIMKRFTDKFPTQEAVKNASIEDLRSVGLTLSKANYISLIAQEIESGNLNLNALYEMPDDQAIKELTRLKGIGVWSAKIILIHSYNRLNLDTYEDIALRNSVKSFLQLEEINRDTFEHYFKSYEPYRSIACIYHWYYIAQIK